MEKGQTVYTRKATGLVRGFSGWDMMIFNIFAISIGLVLMVGPLEAAALYPGVHLNLTLTLGAILALGNALVWALLMVAMPRSGGVFVVGSSLLHPAIGFMLSWGEMMTLIYAAGMYSNWTAGLALPVALSTIGASSNIPGLVTLGENIVTPINIFIVGTIVIILACIISMFPRLQKIIFKSVFAFCIFGSILALAVLASTTPEGFRAAFDRFVFSASGIPNGYNYILDKATELGFQTPSFNWNVLLMSIPIGYWMFMGYFASAHIAGEIKEPSKGIPLSIIGSLIFCWVFFAINIEMFYRVVGWNFTHALAYLMYNHPEALPIQQMPYFNLIVGIISGNPIINGIIGLSFILWCLFVPLVVFTVATRYIFIWAFYRIIPEKISAVSSKFRSPWVAIIVTGIAAWLFLIIYTFTPFFEVVLKYTLMNSITYLIIGICAILLPLRKKELFEASPSIVKKRIAGIPLIWIGAIVNIFLYSLIIYSSFSWSLEDWSFLVLVFLPALIVYYVSRTLRKRQGLDLDLAFKEIPPE